MTAVPAARVFFVLALALFGSSCVFHSTPVITSDSGAVQLKTRFTNQLRDLEYATGKRYKGKSIHIKDPVPAIYRDWRKMPVAKIRGRRQGGLTSWRAVPGHTTVYLASWRGNTPEWLIRHEALHTVLLSHNITGHPSRYANLFAKSYWWMPESYYRDKARAKSEADKKPTPKTKGKSRPLMRSVFNRAQREGIATDLGEVHAACCPICGIDIETLAKQSVATSD